MTGIFYGSTTGNTEALAEQIAKKMGVAASDIHNVGSAQADKAEDYDCLLLGSSTWGSGELQDDWYDFIEKLKTKNLSGKKVGLFGCGDSGSYPDTFGDALGILHEELADTGCTFVGEIDAAGYGVTDSKAFDGGKAYGLIADDDDPGQTDARLDKWIGSIKA